ncbi:MAG: PorT family protein [Bacteroidales bacterium]|nr:PorT family protein [Bacteroidales bacterium]
MTKTLKHILITAFLLGLSCPTIVAQVKFGGKVSGTINNMFLVQDTSKNMRRGSVAGFNVGVMAEYLFRENMSVGIEVMFAMQGFKRSWVSTYDHPAVIPTVENTTCRTFHLNIPVLYRFYYRGLAFEAGPQVSVCFDGKRKFHREQTIHDQSLVFDTAYTFSSLETEMQKYLSGFKLWNRITFGATAGISYTLDNGLMFGIRYTYDFNNSFNDMIEYEYEKYRSETYKSHHSVVQISVGLKI